MSKTKREKIRFVVEMDVTYDPTFPGARKHIIERCEQDLPINMGGGGVDVGCYSAKRGAVRVIEGVTKP